MPPDTDPEDAEEARTEALAQSLGRALGALIDEQSPAESKTPPPPPGPAAMPAPPAAGGPGKGRRAVALGGYLPNILGTTLALWLAWVGYHGLASLPAAPLASPWARLGQGRAAVDSSPSLASRLENPPVGQLRYGPELRPSPPAAEETAPVWIEAAPAVVFYSLRELETAFETQYRPPPDCHIAYTPEHRARCGNHRLRARQAFLASRGQTLVPEESRPDPAATGSAPSWTPEGRPTWRRPGSPAANTAPETVPNWRNGEAPAPEPIPLWRAPPPPEVLSRTAPPVPSADRHGGGSSEPPRPPRPDSPAPWPPPSEAMSWRDEQRWRESQPPPGQAWWQNEQAPGYVGQGSGDRPEEAIPDWRREWLRRP